MASLIETRDRARSLRRDLTAAEDKLWGRLRGRQLGAKFRRQHPIGPFITDFCCIEKRLVIELDGSQHLGQEEDRKRAAYLRDRGYRVMRFWDGSVFAEIEGILEQVRIALDDPSGGSRAG